MSNLDDFKVQRRAVVDKIGFDGFRSTYSTKIGKVTIRAQGDTVVGLELNSPDSAEGNFPVAETKVIRKALEQLMEYLEGNRRSFDLGLGPEGSPFQSKVWAALLKIPFGQSVSYRQLALIVGNPRATRAVATACGRNPIAVFIPCHRVIYSNGGIGGYSGGVAIKKMLLDMEGVRLGRG
ncbi:MAG: methylated-DNA--[protein]-cysteine S-methyltransferase [Rickettsiales bacterium]|jgi:methylated-DNA-[protein]-cysteine S-methyltransferase|nr:methylated-DNA--[protein]-cysteine S-methyltransferase [Rickettsiales bacterium]